MHRGLCVCALCVPIATRTRIVLVIHRAEIRKPTNTGHIAALCLPHSEIHVRGHEGAPSAPIAWGDTQPVLLFPHEDAQPIESLDLRRPVTLVIPDGNWRQASKVRARVPGLRAIPCVRVGAAEPSRYRLRSEAHAHGLATMEAIARALGVLEGPAVRRALEHVFDVMVERTLWVRGSLAEDGVTGGVPKRASKHDPGSAVPTQTAL
jgi:DTW domain-containing protein